MAKEVWKPVVGFHLYEVSNLGRVRSVLRLIEAPTRWGGVTQCWVGGKVLATVFSPSRGGALYEKAPLLSEARTLANRRTMFIHRLVAEAFCPNPDGKPQVNHKNGVSTDNRADNLEWVTQPENIRHADQLRGAPRKGRAVIVVGVEYPSLVVAAKEVGICMTHLWNVLNGRKKTVRGMNATYR